MLYNLIKLNPLFVIPALIIGIPLAANYLWKQWQNHQALRGRHPRPLGHITRDLTRFATKDDNTPLHNKLPPSVTAKKVHLTLLAATLITLTFNLPLLPRWAPLAAALTFALFLSARYRPIAAQRNNVLNQMFAVANAQFRYGKGSETQPWVYVKIAQWSSPTSPGETHITIPAGTATADPQLTEKFERNFNETVTEENSWTYTWESTKNRLIIKPAPHIPPMASYPGPGEKWDEIPIGIKGDGTQAIVPLSVTPHTLVCGPTGSGKMYHLDTLTPLKGGWKPLGELKVGDELFGIDGNLTKIVDLSPIVVSEKAYEVVFSDGSRITVDADHLWWTETRSVHESRRTEARKDRKRRPLVSAEGVARLDATLAETARDDEISLPEAAAIAGVNAGSSWVRELAKDLGHVSEVTQTVVHHYADQVVQQEQTVLRFPARDVLGALGQFQPKVPAWFVLRDECAQRAKVATVGSVVTVPEMAVILDADVKSIDKFLRAADVPRERRDGQGKTMFWDERAAWSALAQARSPREVSWLDRREWFSEQARNAAAGDTVTTNDLMAQLGLDRQSTLATVKRLGFKGTPSREMVELAVVGKTVPRETMPVPHYNKRALLGALRAAGDTAAWDQRHERGHGAVRTTEEIRQTLRTPHGHANHSIPVAQPLVLPEADLPIGPYAFGAWLGAEASSTNNVGSIDREVVLNIEAEGYTVHEHAVARDVPEHPGFRDWRIEGIRKPLTSLGVLKRKAPDGPTKRIPMLYLRSSVEQRRALLAGLLDIDGTVGDSGCVEITQVNELLARDIKELAVSLGYQSVIREGRATVNGVDAGPLWTVSFTPEVSPFRLSRKTAVFGERSVWLAERNGRRYIVDVVEVEPAPMRCVMVDSPDRLFLVGESMVPTHNSVLQRAVLFHILAHKDTWRLVAIDMKRVEMSWLREYPEQVLEVAVDLESATDTLRMLKAEMNRRYEEMEAAGVNHAKDLPNPPHALFCMIDEATMLLAPTGGKDDESKEKDALKAECSAIIGDLGRLSRASMIHVMMCFQRPDAVFLKGETKANFDARIAAGRMDTTPSLMVLDSEAAARLPKIKGRGMVRIGGEMDVFQGYFAEADWYDKYRLEQEAIARGESVPGEVVEVGEPEPGAADGVNGGRGLKGALSRLKAKAGERAGDPVDDDVDPVDGSTSNDAPDVGVGDEAEQVDEATDFDFDDPDFLADVLAEFEGFDDTNDGEDPGAGEPDEVIEFRENTEDVDTEAEGAEDEDEATEDADVEDAQDVDADVTDAPVQTSSTLPPSGPPVAVPGLPSVPGMSGGVPGLAPPIRPPSLPPMAVPGLPSVPGLGGGVPGLGGLTAPVPATPPAAPAGWATSDDDEMDPTSGQGGFPSYD